MRSSQSIEGIGMHEIFIVNLVANCFVELVKETEDEVIVLW